MSKVYISIGSNLGCRINYLRQAVHLLSKNYLRNVQCSIILETKCILPEHAPDAWNKDFLNMIVVGHTDLSPQVLLQGLKLIESQIGRQKKYSRWSPRIIDLDILIWPGVQVHSTDLTIPHPELQNRPFFLHLLQMMGAGDFTNHILPKASFSKSLVLFPKFVGVVNITSDSFSDGGEFNIPEKAVSHILRLANDGASVIEIGAQSTRPGAIINSPQEEYQKLKQVLDNIKPLLANNNIVLSIDSFWPTVIHEVLNHYPIAWINDVKGDLDDKTLRLIAERNCKLCIMHSLTVPASNQHILPLEQSPMKIIIAWANQQIERLLLLGFKPENIIIDPGIGFGKSIYQNLDILKNLGQLKNLGTPVLLGHSRKSYISAFSTQAAYNRDIETIAVSSLVNNDADFLRVHNVADHMRFFVAKHAIQWSANDID